MGSRFYTPRGTDSALAAAVATANDALAAIKNGPLMDATSELCWTCNAATACAIDDAREKIAAAMEHLREAVAYANAETTADQMRDDPAPVMKQDRQSLRRAAMGFADE